MAFKLSMMNQFHDVIFYSFGMFIAHILYAVRTVGLLPVFAKEMKTVICEINQSPVPH